MLNDIAFSQILQGIITSKESLLKDRLEGGLSTIRNDEFVTNDFENEDIILTYEQAAAKDSFESDEIFKIVISKLNNF